MNRRTLLEALGIGAAGLFARRALAADASIDASAGATAEASAGSTQATLVASTVALGVVVLGGVISLVVFLSIRSARRRREGELVMLSPAEALLRTGVQVARLDLGRLLGLYAESPAALATLAAEAKEGAGDAIDDVARAAQLPPARVASAVLTAWAPVRTQVDASRFAVRLVAELAPDLEARDDDAAWWLDALLREAHAGESAGSAHGRLFGWMGVDAPVGVPVVRETLGPLARADVYAAPLDVADRLARALYAASPDGIDARLQAMKERVYAIDAELGAGIFA